MCAYISKCISWAMERVHVVGMCVCVCGQEGGVREKKTKQKCEHEQETIIRQSERARQKQRSYPQAEQTKTGRY